MPMIHSRNDSPNGASRMSMERFSEINDILDWLSSVFGFQVINVFLICFFFLILYTSYKIADIIEICIFFPCLSSSCMMSHMGIWNCCFLIFNTPYRHFQKNVINYTLKTQKCITSQKCLMILNRGSMLFAIN